MHTLVVIISHLGYLYLAAIHITRHSVHDLAFYVMLMAALVLFDTDFGVEFDSLGL